MCTGCVGGVTLDVVAAAMIDARFLEQLPPDLRAYVLAMRAADAARQNRGSPVQRR